MEQHFARLMQFAEGIAGIETVLGNGRRRIMRRPTKSLHWKNSDHSNVFVASGFGKWGLTNGTTCGKYDSGSDHRRSCQYEEVYSRKRADYLSSLGKTITEVFYPIGELIKSKLERPEDIDRLNWRGAGDQIPGTKGRIYRDVDNTVTHFGYFLYAYVDRVEL
jgi:hypothetical protein